MTRLLERLVLRTKNPRAHVLLGILIEILEAQVIAAPRFL